MLPEQTEQWGFPSLGPCTSLCTPLDTCNVSVSECSYSQLHSSCLSVFWYWSLVASCIFFVCVCLCAPEAKQRPYYADYSPLRLSIHTLCTSHYLDLFITFIICINVFTMSIEHYNQPRVMFLHIHILTNIIVTWTFRYQYNLIWYVFLGRSSIPISSWAAIHLNPL